MERTPARLPAHGRNTSSCHQHCHCRRFYRSDFAQLPGASPAITRRKEKAAAHRAISRTQSSCDGEGGWVHFPAPQKAGSLPSKALRPAGEVAQAIPRHPKEPPGCFGRLQPCHPPLFILQEASRGTLRKQMRSCRVTSCTLPQFPRAPGVKAYLPGEACALRISPCLIPGVSKAPATGPWHRLLLPRTEAPPAQWGPAHPSVSPQPSQGPP